MHDKVTHESKGSAFVWYATRTDAERAILQFNFRHVLPDPSGDQDRPLVVRRAKMRAKPVKQPGALTLGALTPVSAGRAPELSAHIPHAVLNPNVCAKQWPCRRNALFHIHDLGSG